MAYLLGVDIGTWGTKTVLFDEMGNTISSAFSEHPLYQPNAGWAEQDPEDWWKAACTTIREALGKGMVKPAEIKGIGLSGQMHGAVLLDKRNKVLRNAIIWCDQRSTAECEQITSIVGKERLLKVTANPALTDFTASKVMWVKNNEPKVFKKINKILLPKDYIRFKLTGEFATEVSDASGMQFMDVARRRWSGEVLGKLGIDRSLLGELYESHEVSGTVHTSAAKHTGLKEGTPVVGGAGDQAAAAIGNGIVRPGVILSAIGVPGVVSAFSPIVSIDPRGRVRTFCHAIPYAWNIVGVAQGAGLPTQWFMDEEAENAAAGFNGIIYSPHMMEKRTLHLDYDAKGAFFGMAARHNKLEMLRMEMENIVFKLKDYHENIKEMGFVISEVRVSGGGSKSKLWRQMQADVFGKQITTVNSDEGESLGAAILAGVGTGVYGSVGEACDTLIKVKARQAPDMALYASYQKFHSIYRNFYGSFKKSFKVQMEI